MSRLIDLTGRDIAGWHVLSRAANDKYGMARWLCRCRTCGLVVRVHGGNLRASTSRQCRSCSNKRPHKQLHPVGSAAE